MNRVVEATMLGNFRHNNVDSGSNIGWIHWINHGCKNLKKQIWFAKSRTAYYSRMCVVGKSCRDQELLVISGGLSENHKITASHHNLTTSFQILGYVPYTLPLKLPGWKTPCLCFGVLFFRIQGTILTDVKSEGIHRDHRAIDSNIRFHGDSGWNTFQPELVGVLVSVSVPENLPKI